MDDKDAKKVIEAVLFSSNEVLMAKQLVLVLGNGNVKRIKALVAELNHDYEKTNRSFRIVKIGDGFQLRTLPMFRTWIQKLVKQKPFRLTQSTLETLSIVAYRQPVTRAEVEHLRGVDASHALRSLLENKLIRILGKDQGAGRALLYGTSIEFLSLFNLSDIRELPTLSDFDLAVEEETGEETGEEEEEGQEMRPELVKDAG